MEFPIVFEDPDLLIINKPAGIVVNNAESVKGETVQDWASVRLGIPNTEYRISKKDTNENPDSNIDIRDSNFEFLSRAGIVHRIDKETSGLLIIAKNVESFVNLQAAFKERTIHKTYVAICHGMLEPEEGEIRAPVGRLPWQRERFGIVPGGKESITMYKRLAVAIHAQTNKAMSEHISLVSLFPQTGRTHQIRVHLKYINHPIVGDYLYAGRKMARSDRIWAPRVMLHAWKLTLTHPRTGSLVSVIADVPEDMQSIIHVP